MRHTIVEFLTSTVLFSPMTSSAHVRNPQFSTVLFAACLALVTGAAHAQITFNLDIEKAPFKYSDTDADNRVSRLIEKIDAEQVALEYTRANGYLRSLLRELDIDESSQMLVFSKTSMQVQHISRRNPRAIYFNDDTYVGWVRGSSLVEISTTDPKLGAAFYTCEMGASSARFAQKTYNCLACHATALTQGIPGHTVRSVMPKVDGSIDSQKLSYITSDTSPFSERWGGWYVTGEHGDMKHMGNAFLRGGRLDTSRNSNLKNAREMFDTWDYISPFSDIRALMVLEHQTQMQNEMVRADFYVRQLLHDSERRTETEGEQEEWQVQLMLIAKEVVDRLLFCGETQLTDEVKGSMVFTKDFVARGPVDRRGRSLREFDMQTRMFKYPLSYLIYSAAFESLQPCLREEIVQQLRSVLTGQNLTPEYRHLSNDDRASILAILSDTHPAFSK